MRLKLLIVFFVTFAIIFAIRAYGDYTTGGFPAYGWLNFIYWTFLYSLIPLMPAFFIIQIATPSKTASINNLKTKAPTYQTIVFIFAKVIFTLVAMIIGLYSGFWIGLMINSGDGGLDFGAGPYGALIGASISLLICWYFFAKRKIA